MAAVKVKKNPRGLMTEAQADALSTRIGKGVEEFEFAVHDLHERVAELEDELREAKRELKEKDEEIRELTDEIATLEAEEP